MLKSTSLLVLFATGCLTELEDPPEVSTTEAASTTALPVYLRWLSVDKDGEAVGDPEIYVRCHVGGRYYSRVWLDSVNDANEWYAPNVYVGTLYPNEYIVCDFRESDGSTADDYIGHADINYNTLGGTSATDCAAYGTNVSAQFSRVKGVNQCPELPWTCPQDC